MPCEFFAGYPSITAKALSREKLSLGMRKRRDARQRSTTHKCSSSPSRWSRHRGEWHIYGKYPFCCRVGCGREHHCLAQSRGQGLGTKAEASWQAAGKKHAKLTYGEDLIRRANGPVSRRIGFRSGSRSHSLLTAKRMRHRGAMKNRAHLKRECTLMAILIGLPQKHEFKSATNSPKIN